MIKIRQILAITLILTAAIPSALLAAEINIEANADRTELSMSDRLTLSIKVSASVAGSLPDPTLPSHDGFDIVGSPFQSTSFSWINGQVSASKTINYTLLPRMEGNFRIGASSVSFRGQTYTSKPVEVIVSKGREPEKSKDESEPAIVSADPYGRLLVSASIDKNQVYIGEGVVYTFSFFRKVRLWESPEYNPPKFTDFWTEDLPKSDRGREVVVKGDKYIREDIKKILFPTREGFLTIGSTSISAQIDPFARPVTLITKPVEMEVLPLPEGPEGFSGTVGNFTITAEVDKKKVKEGDPLMVKVQIAGAGNIRGISQPLYEESESFSVYEPKDSMDISTFNNMITGTKTFEYLFIPMESGELTLPQFKYIYFDPAKDKYETLKTKAMKVSVAPSEKGGSLATGAGGEYRKARLIKKNLRPIRMKSDLGDWNPWSYFRGFSLAVIIIPPFMFLVIWGYGNMSRKRASVANPYKKARGSLKEAEGYIADGAYKDFFSQTDTAVRTYFAEILNMPPAALSRDDLIMALKAAECPGELLDRIEKALSRADLGRFSPARYGVEEMEEFHNEIMSILKAAEEMKLGRGGKK